MFWTLHAVSASDPVNVLGLREPVGELEVQGEHLRRHETMIGASVGIRVDLDQDPVTRPDVGTKRFSTSTTR